MANQAKPESEAADTLTGTPSTQDINGPIGKAGAVGDPLDPRLDSAAAIGLDAGSSLVKAAVLDPSGQIHLAVWLSPGIDRTIDMLKRLAPGKVGLTGSGASEVVEGMGEASTTYALADLGAIKPAIALEFDAWGRGANHLLRSTDEIQDAPYLLVSIGTGTSLLYVDGDKVERVGGTALGGGTAVGLGVALTKAQSHDALIEMASRGHRGNVDLLISDVYDPGEVPLAGEGTASSFGKIARGLSDPGKATPPTEPDLAAAAMGLVAENISLLCTAHAKATGVQTIVYGGSTLAHNPALVNGILLVTRLFGFQAVSLPHSGHAGALGALLLAD